MAACSDRQCDVRRLERSVELRERVGAVATRVDLDEVMGVVERHRHHLTGVTGVTCIISKWAQNRRVPGTKSRFSRITKINRGAVETYDDFVITLRHSRVMPNSNKNSNMHFTENS